MKKGLLGVFIILLLCGCSVNVNYNFKKDVIESTIDASFNIEEYYDEVIDEDDTDEDIEKSKLESNLLRDKDSILLNAFKNNSETYKEISFTKDNNYNYKGQYKYDYNYDNFINNYLFNCFENFKYTEDENYYNIELSGKYSCNTNVKIKVSAEFGIDNSNSIEVKDGVHTFDIYEDNNKIVFSVRKHRFDNVNTTYTIRLIAFIVMCVMIIITFVSYKILKRNEY